MSGTDNNKTIQKVLMSRATGRSASMDLHHYFRFRDGKIEYSRGTEDTAQTEATLEA